MTDPAEQGEQDVGVYWRNRAQKAEARIISSGEAWQERVLLLEQREKKL